MRDPDRGQAKQPSITAFGTGRAASAWADQAGLVGEDEKLSPVPGAKFGDRPAGVGFTVAGLTKILREISSLDSPVA